jgi:hypothetical protein
MSNATENPEVNELSSEELADVNGGLSLVGLIPVQPLSPAMLKLRAALLGRFDVTTAYGPAPLRPRLMNAYPADLVELVEELDNAESATE